MSHSLTGNVLPLSTTTPVNAAEVEAELARIGHDLQPLDIVLVNTSAGAVFGQPGYVDSWTRAVAIID